MDIILFIGLSIFSLVLLSFLFFYKKRNNELRAALDNKEAPLSDPQMKEHKESSLLFNQTEYFIGSIEIHENDEFILEFLNQAAINFINAQSDSKPLENFSGVSLEFFFRDLLKFPPDQVELKIKQFKEVTEQKDRVTHELPFVLKNQEQRYFESTLTPVINPETGKCEQILFIGNDVTKRVEIQKALISSEAHAKTLFEYSPIIIWDEDFSELKKRFDALKEEGISDFRKYFDDYPDQLESLSSLIKVKDVNQKSVDFYDMGSKENHITEIPFYFIDESWEVLKNEFIALAEGQTSFESEIPIKKIDGSIIYLIINLSIPPIYLDTWESIIVSFLDVSERKASELLLAKSKEKINIQLERNKLIIENTLNGYVLADTEGNIAEVNAAYADLTGYSKQELSTMNIRDIEVHISPEEMKKNIQNLVETGSARFETLHKKKDGSILILDANLSFMQYENSPMIAAFLRDITAQKQAQKDLEYRFKFESLLAKISTQFINLNIDQTGVGITDALRQLCEFTDFDHSTISLFSNKGNTFSVSYEWHKNHIEDLKTDYQDIHESVLPWLFKTIKKNDSIFISNLSDIPNAAIGVRYVFQNSNLHALIHVPMTWQGEVIGFISFSHSKEKTDLHLNIEVLLRFASEMICNALQRKKAVNELKENEKKANEMLISKILETEDRERKRISKELHDSLGQNLTTASLNLVHLKNNIEQLDDHDQLKFKNGLKFLNIAINESRNIAHNLMPQSIVDFGYLETIESLVEDLSNSSKTQFIFYSNLQERLSSDQELSLFRITQEAINNILKHAEASKATIQLMKYEDAILLTIEDNGKGFDILNRNGHSFGFDSIKARVNALSGHVDIDSRQGQGTSITIKIDTQEVLAN